MDEERMRRTDERIAAIAESLELVGGMQQENEKQIRRLVKYARKTDKQIKALIDVAFAYQRRIDGLEKQS